MLLQKGGCKMAAIYYEVCDRCHKEIKYNGRTAKIFKRPARTSKFKILSVFNGNPTGYDYSERYVELCKECTERLDMFLSEDC